MFDFGMGVDEHGRFKGHLKATGTRPKFAEKLRTWASASAPRCSSRSSSPAGRGRADDPTRRPRPLPPAARPGRSRRGLPGGAVGPAALAQDRTRARSSAIRRSTPPTPSRRAWASSGTASARALEDLTVREDGQERQHEPVEPLSATGVETGLVVAVDTSRSMARNGGVTATQETLLRHGRRPAGQRGHGPRHLRDHGEGAQPAHQRQGRSCARRSTTIVAPSNADTALWDGVVKAASMFPATSELQPNIVLITDGNDDSSAATRAGPRRR